MNNAIRNNAEILYFTSIPIILLQLNVSQIILEQTLRLYSLCVTNKNTGNVLQSS